MSVNFNFLVEKSNDSISLFEKDEVDKLSQLVIEFPSYVNFLIKTLDEIPLFLIFLVREEFVQKYGKYVILKNTNNSEKSLKSDFFSTIVSVKSDSELEILKPGLLETSELAKILPKVKIKKNYHHKLFKVPRLEIAKINTKNELDSVGEDLLILGTKEKIREVAPGISQTKNSSGKSKIVVVGSQTNTQNIVYFLANRLDNFVQEESKKIYWMNQAWPKNHWGEILEYFSLSIVAPN